MRFETTADSLPVPSPAAASATVTASAGSPRRSKAKASKPKAAKPAAKKAAAPAPAKPATKGGAKQTAKTSAPAKPAKGAPKLSAMSAAAKVLADSKAPMNVKQIIAEMSSKGLWSSPGGRTPHSTLAAAIGRDINAKGRESRFRKVDRGMFTASGR